MPNAQGQPVVFISYAHESDAFREQVKALADWLAEQRCEVLTDHPYRYRPPAEGWQAWMLKCIREADTVLVVGSPKYRARYEKTAPLGSGQGATYEGAILTQEIYDASMRNEKHYPLLPDGGAYEDIPTTLRPWWSNHRFPSGNAGILALVRECASPQHGSGAIRLVASRSPPPAATVVEASSEPSDAIEGDMPPSSGSTSLQRKADRDFVAHARAKIAETLRACPALKFEVDKRLADPDAEAATDLVALLETVKVLETVVNNYLRPPTIACLEGLAPEGDDFRHRWNSARAVLAWLAVLSVKGDWVEEFERRHGNFAGVQVDIPVATGLGVEIVSSRFRQQQTALPRDIGRADLHGTGRFDTPLMPVSYALQKELDALLLHIWSRIFPEESRKHLSASDLMTLNAELRVHAANRTAHHYLAFSPGADTPLNQQDFLAALLKALPDLPVIRLTPKRGVCPMLVGDEYDLVATIRSFLKIPDNLRSLH